MRDSSDDSLVWKMLVLLGCVVIAANGCSRSMYRLQADSEAYDVIAERNTDPRWDTPNYSIDVDPRSRYYDAYDPDRSPMPADDPVSHQYMHDVNGMKGWKHWHDNGERNELENPQWREALAEYVELDEEGALKLDVDSALRVAYVHSPSHQSQLETLYLSALDVTAERFRLETQYFGGYDARYAHNGSLIPPALRFNPTLGRFVINPAIDGNGVENNRLTLGRPLAGNPAFQARRQFATAGELLAGFANSFVFEFTSGNANLSASLANFSLIQPLLRGAGRDIALEQLTRAERTLLGNLRAYSQYRQGFYTQVAIGELGVTGPQRGGTGTNLRSFSGQGSVGGYLGLLQRRQQIRNSVDNLSLQDRTLLRLKSLRLVGWIDLVQVEQFRQNVERERASLLLSRKDYQLSLDRYKTSTLGLPPDLFIELDDSLIRQFQLVTRDGTTLLDSIVKLQDRIGNLPDDVGIEAIGQVLLDAFKLVKPVMNQFDAVQADLDRMNEVVSAREQTMTDDQRNQFQSDREQLVQTLADLKQNVLKTTIELESLPDEISEPVGRATTLNLDLWLGHLLAPAELDRLRMRVLEEMRRATARKLVVWVGNVLRIVEPLVLVQANARLETIVVETIALESGAAFEIALANRLDFMNGRAALVDSWRSIQFNADALQSVLNVTASGDVRTAKNNPVSFRAPTGSLRLGLEVDAPFTRLLERNDYRESLIDYQRSRRGFIQSRDALHLGLRELLRQLAQLRETLEIQRLAVTIAIKRVDLTQEELAAPAPTPRPGQPQRKSPTTATNLLSAQSSLRSTQNNFLRVWLDYYSAQMRLSRELGIMVLDEEGRWIDRSLPNQNDEIPLDLNGPKMERLPPPILTRWIELEERLPEQTVIPAQTHSSPDSAGPEPLPFHLPILLDSE